MFYDGGGCCTLVFGLVDLSWVYLIVYDCYIHCLIWYLFTWWHSEVLLLMWIELIMVVMFPILFRFTCCVLFCSLLRSWMIDCWNLGFDGSDFTGLLFWCLLRCECETYLYVLCLLVNFVLRVDCCWFNLRVSICVTGGCFACWLICFCLCVRAFVVVL